MELKTLVIGMFISTAAFSVKTGVGLAYLWQSGARGRRLAVVPGVALAYAALFWAVYIVASRLNVIAHYDKLIPLLRGGLALHWLAAALTFVWGLCLFKMCGRHGDGPDGGGLRGGMAPLALIVPCPVCGLVVLMSTSCAALYFPDDAALATAALYAAFMTLAAVSAALSALARKPGGSAERSLGAAMIMTASYFMLSVLVTPHFAEVGRIYRLAAYSRGDSSGNFSGRAVMAVIFSLAAIGYLGEKFKNRKSKRAAESPALSGGGGETP